MSIRRRILDSAEALFDEGGFGATGVDRLCAAADVSSRTLYRHVGSKSGLVVAVLAARDARYLAALEVGSVAELFAALERWFGTEGARGCLFLRALGESGGGDAAVARAVAGHKRRVRAAVRRVVAAEIGARDDVADQIHVLIEGATAAAVELGPEAARIAARAAATLLDAAGGTGR